MDVIYLLLGLEIVAVILISFFLIKKIRRSTTGKNIRLPFRKKKNDDN